MAYTQPIAPVRTAPVSARNQHQREALIRALSVSVEAPPRVPRIQRYAGLIVAALSIASLVGGAIAEAAR